MKTRYNNLYILLLIINIGLFSGCNHESQPMDSATGSLLLHLHTNLDSLEVADYNTINILSNGRKISLSLAQLYISNIQLIRMDGFVYPLSGVIVLKTFENETYPADKVPSGNYKSIRFSVGLDSTSNEKVPVSEADSLQNNPSMWFWTSAQPKGYVFVNLQGKIDTTKDGTGTEGQMQPFIYKIGTNANYRQVVLPDNNFTIFPNQQTFVHLIINYMQLLKGVQLSNSNNLLLTDPSENSTPLAIEISNNIPVMFKYE